MARLRTFKIALGAFPSTGYLKSIGMAASTVGTNIQVHTHRILTPTLTLTTILTTRTRDYRGEARSDVEAFAEQSDRDCRQRVGSELSWANRRADTGRNRDRYPRGRKYASVTCARADFLFSLIIFRAVQFRATTMQLRGL